MLVVAMDLQHTLKIKQELWAGIKKAMSENKINKLLLLMIRRVELLHPPRTDVLVMLQLVKMAFYFKY